MACDVGPPELQSMRRLPARAHLKQPLEMAHRRPDPSPSILRHYTPLRFPLQLIALT